MSEWAELIAGLCSVVCKFERDLIRRLILFVSPCESSQTLLR